MQFDFARESDLPALARLWREAFSEETVARPIEVLRKVTALVRPSGVTRG